MILGTSVSMRIPLDAVLERAGIPIRNQTDFINAAFGAIRFSDYVQVAFDVHAVALTPSDAKEAN